MRLQEFFRYCLLLAILTPMLTWASSPILPPQGFDEGTETQLTPSQIQEILPWAQNSEIALKDLLDSIRTLPSLQAKQTLTRGIEQVILASAPKQTETLMRYILNRALKINAEIEQSASFASAAGVLDQQLRVLVLSARLALEYYQSDVEFLNGRATKKDSVVLPPFATFGLRYVQFLMSVDNSLLDISAQYNIAVIALGLFQWDLYRDQNHLAFAPSIGKIQTLLKSIPERIHPNDSQGVFYLRSLKKAYGKALELALQALPRSISLEPQYQNISHPSSETQFAEYIDLLRSNNLQNRILAVQGIAKMPDIRDSAKVIASYLYESPDELAQEIIKGLHQLKLRDDQLILFKDYPSSSSWRYRRDVVKILCNVDTSASTDLILYSLGDKDTDVAWEAIACLKSRTFTPNQLENIAAGLVSSNSQVVDFACRKLSNIESAQTTSLVVGAIAKGFTQFDRLDSFLDHRRQVGLLSEDIFQKLSSLLTGSTNWQVRRWAVLKINSSFPNHPQKASVFRRQLAKEKDSDVIKAIQERL